MGAFAGISMSCPPAILRKWVPADERGTLVGGALSGGTFGVIVAMPLSGVIVKRLGCRDTNQSNFKILVRYRFCNDIALNIVSLLRWEAVFYVFGALSLLWGLLWFLFARESPDKMTWINSDELAYIESKVVTVDQKSKQIPFKNICLSLPYWVSFNILTIFGQL